MKHLYCLNCNSHYNRFQYYLNKDKVPSCPTCNGKLLTEDDTITYLSNKVSHLQQQVDNQEAQMVEDHELLVHTFDNTRSNYKDICHIIKDPTWCHPYS